MGTHPIFESDFDCLTGFRRKCQLNWHAPTPPLSSTTMMSRSLATRSPPFSRPPTSNLNHSGHHSSLVPSRTSLRSLITNIGSGVGSGPAAGGAAAAGGDAGAAEAPAEEAKKAESSSEEDDDMGFGLFD